jgi:transcriptional regulator with XRE-family HTH domain
VAKPISPLHRAFGRAVRQLRDELGLSQEALGQKTGLHRNYIGGVERGELNPSLTNISKLARGLKCDPSELLALAEELEPRRTRVARRG